MKHEMQGLLLVLLVNYAPTTVFGSEQHTITAPVFAPGKGTIRLGQACDTSIDCKSGCCLFNKTAGIGECHRLEQRYSGCSPRRPKGTEGTLLDVYIHYCPCKPHLRCAKTYTWHVCLKRKGPLEPEKPTPPPPEKPPGKPPGWVPGMGTHNGTLGLGEVCGTSIDCSSGCCVYNPRLGFSYCHMLQQRYDDCSPWHRREEKGTFADVYFQHCPCNKHLKCTKDKKWHLCRKREPTVGPSKPSQEKPAQQPEKEKPQFGTQEREQMVEMTAVGNAESYTGKSETPTQQPVQGQVQQQNGIGESQKNENESENKRTIVAVER